MSLRLHYSIYSQAGSHYWWHRGLDLLLVRLGLVHPSLDDLVVPGSPRSTISIPNLVRTPDRHGPLSLRGPELKQSSSLSLPAAWTTDVCHRTRRENSASSRVWALTVVTSSGNTLRWHLATKQTASVERTQYIFHGNYLAEDKYGADTVRMIHVHQDFNTGKWHTISQWYTWTVCMVELKNWITITSEPVITSTSCSLLFAHCEQLNVTHQNCVLWKWGSLYETGRDCLRKSDRKVKKNINGLIG